MAKRDNTFLIVAAGLAYLAWQLFKPATGAGPATNQNGTAGGGVSGSPYQAVNQTAALLPGGRVSAINPAWLSL